MAKRRVDDFLNLVRRSGLVERDQLNRVLRRLKEEAAGKPIKDTDFVAERMVEALLLTSWQCDRLLEGRYRGFFLKKYKLLDHLGTGGMSSVYLAEHTLMRRRVAIKVLPKARVEDATYLPRFHREARAAAALDHENIVRAYDVDNEDDTHFLVMEYIQGRDLLVMVREDGPLDYDAAADYVRQAALGLEHAHQAGLIHRDVKPANLLVDTGHVVKVLDLGLARFTGEEQGSLTVANDENVLGTADYLAPEQALDSHRVDARADIYSLGCSLYYVLTGHPPFPDGTLPQRLMMHQKEPPPSIYNDRPDAPEDLVEICLLMMAKKADDRPQSMAEVADLLGKWLIDHGHGVDSDSGSSSGKLMVAAAAVARQTTPAEGSSRPPVGRPGSGSARPKRSAKTGSGSGRVKPKSPAKFTATSDTLAQTQAHTVETPLAEQEATVDAQPEIEIALPADDNPNQEISLPEFFVQVDSPALARLRSKHQLTPEQIEAYQKRRKGTPIWVWAVVGGGTLLALILLAIFLISG